MRHFPPHHRAANTDTPQPPWPTALSSRTMSSPRTTTSSSGKGRALITSTCARVCVCAAKPGTVELSQGCLRRGSPGSRRPATRLGALGRGSMMKISPLAGGECGWLPFVETVASISSASVNIPDSNSFASNRKALRGTPFPSNMSPATCDK